MLGSTETVKIILENWKEVGIDIITAQIGLGQTILDILQWKYNYGRIKDVITMLEEEYLKIDASEQLCSQMSQEIQNFNRTFNRTFKRRKKD